MLLVFTCVFQVKWKDDTCYMVAGRRGVFLRQTECRFLWCGGKEKDVEGRRADRWRDAGNNDLFLPTRQPWVLLHGWSECNKPWFFRLTAGACEHTSSPLWERRMSRQSPCLRLFLFLLLSLSVSQQSLSDAVLVSVLCVFSLFLHVTKEDIRFTLLCWRKSIWGLSGKFTNRKQKSYKS